jgi:hypothetical protein
MSCIYFVYKKYCDKNYKIEKQKYGYADLTDYKCEFKDCQIKCKNYKPKEKQR